MTSSTRSPRTAVGASARRSTTCSTGTATRSTRSRPSSGTPPARRQPRGPEETRARRRIRHHDGPHPGGRTGPWAARLLHPPLTVGALLSVIVPCYNQAHFLGEAIESVLRQSYRPFQLVVVDDGATDNTAEVAARYPSVVCVRQANQGLAGARNSGLRASSGEYVLFLDADDRLLPGALDTGAATLDRHPDAAFAVGLHRRIDVAGRPLPLIQRPRIERDHYVSLVRHCWIKMPATVMYRRSALERIGGFDPTMRCAEDYELYLRLTRQATIVDHYTEVAEHRQHDGTLSRNAERMLVGTLRALQDHRPG